MCAQLGAELPLPRKSSELDDFEAIMKHLGLTGYVALDGSDAVSEGVWLDSSGRKGVFCHES